VRLLNMRCAINEEHIGFAPTFFFDVERDIWNRSALLGL
jgi:hypothetical protein